MDCWRAVVTLTNGKDTWKCAFHKWGDKPTKKQMADHTIRLYAGCQGITVVDVEIFLIDERTGQRI